MNIHDILLTVQYITVSVMFIEILIVFARWKNPIHSYLIFSCITSFISNMGYLLEMKAGTEEAYITALKLSYVGRVWIVFAYFLFAAKMCRIRLKKGLICFLVLLHIGIYAAVLSIGSNTLYYTSYEFIADPVYPKFYHGNGSVHDLFLTGNALLIAATMVWTMKEYRREKGRTPRMRLLMLILAFGVQAVFFILQITGIFEISEYYDLTMPGTLFGTIFMLVGIFGFDLLGTREIARDFVIDRISEGIIAVDNDGRIRYYNEPVTKLYPEFDRFFAMKRELEEIISEKEEKENTEEEERQTGVYRTPYDIISGIEEAVRKGETIRIGERVFSPEENDLVHRGVHYGKLYALVDDTEHYRYMEELQKQRDIADSANEAKSRFLANMSHEIRTPINAVLGMDEMILRESSEKTIRGYAADIRSAGRTLLSLINDILDFSKVEEGKMEIIPVQYDLSSLINDLVNMTAGRAEKKGLAFRVEVDAHTPHLLTGDEIRIRQCAMNLLTNAVKYTEKGTVTLKITYREKDEGHILLGVTVEDTGIGMKAEDMENLFSPYKRIEEKRNRSIEGTGLGMSITRQLLDLMGSSLQVKSEYGKGSVFSFEVPQEVTGREEIGDYTGRYQAGTESVYEYHELFHAPSARILVVDDTEMNLTVIRSLLKKTLIRIDTATSGKEALSLCAERDYDVIFIDHMMPDMDGIETLKRIAETDRCKDLPAVALTANAVSGARQRYLDAGFCDYLSKPVDGEALEKLLKRLLPEEKIEAAESPTEAAGEGGKSASENGTGYETEGDDDPAQIPEWVYDLPDVDAEAGIRNCGSAEGYLDVITVFHRTAKTKADEIEAALRDGDISFYTTKVHALKSSARILGAAALSALAEELEEAGKTGDLKQIREKTERLLSMYRSLDDGLAALDRGKDDLPLIDPKSMKEAYQTIIEIAGAMDYALMDGLLKDLRTYRLPEEDEKNVAAIERKLTELDWDGIVRLAEDKRE